jgi:hypothetical protein
MSLRATDAPSAAPRPPPAPMAAVTAMASISALIFASSVVAVSRTSPAAVIALASAWAVVAPRIRFVASAPAPLTPMLTPPEKAAASDAAAAIASMVALPVAVSARAPEVVVAVAFVMRASTVAVIVLREIAAPIDIAPLPAPEKAADTDAAPARVLIVDVSVAVSASEPALIEPPSTDARTVTVMALVASAPAPLSETSTPPEPVTAAEIAPTSEVIVPVALASTVAAPVIVVADDARYARISVPLLIVLRAIEAPSEAAPPPLDEKPPAPLAARISAFRAALLVAATRREAAESVAPWAKAWSCRRWCSSPRRRRRSPRPRPCRCRRSTARRRWPTR